MTTLSADLFQLSQQGVAAFGGQYPPQQQLQQQQASYAPHVSQYASSSYPPVSVPQPVSGYDAPNYNRGYYETPAVHQSVVPSWQPLTQQSAQFQGSLAPVAGPPQQAWSHAPAPSAWGSMPGGQDPQQLTYQQQRAQQLQAPPHMPASGGYAPLPPAAGGGHATMYQQTQALAPAPYPQFSGGGGGASPMGGQGGMSSSHTAAGLMMTASGQYQPFPDAAISSRTALDNRSLDMFTSAQQRAFVPPPSYYDPQMPPLPLAEHQLPSPLRVAKHGNGGDASAGGGMAQTTAGGQPVMCVAQVLIHPSHQHFRTLLSLVEGWGEIQVVPLPEPRPHIWVKAIKTGKWYWDRQAINFLRGYLALVKQQSGAQSHMVLSTASTASTTAGNLSQAFAEPTSMAVVGTSSGKIVSASDFGMDGTSFSATAQPIDNDPRYQAGRIEGSAMAEWYTKEREKWKERRAPVVYRPSEAGDGTFVTM